VTVALVVGAVFYAAIGIAALLRPARLLAGFGLPATTVDARNEIRSVYGGLPLAFAAMLGWAIVHPATAVPFAAAVAVASFGMAGGRIVSALIDRRLGRLPLVFLLLELAIGGLLVGAATA
jgi:hypothetical protein